MVRDIAPGQVAGTLGRYLALLALAAAALAAGCGSRSSQRGITASLEGRQSDSNSTEGVDPASEEGLQVDPTLTQVTLQLNWFPEVEHGGYYAALVHGYYREAGLNVKILPGGADTPVVQQVARRSVTFGIVNADNILFARAQQVPVVAVMAPLQISPRC